ncbi:hypothetical protein BS47DRAFT_1367818 [Hydnum rufescens UP504]|uniref:Uncharacterized protein n=1 Tax=Hydnum rufescens UP504 TaxID=1448309 RepID=A0A9P6AHF3_9AGAM|nr:hypothetical protein BS47DRAFT_1367818 [Hydnum rufescens UP504]
MWIANLIIVTKERRVGGNAWNAFQSKHPEDPQKETCPHHQYVAEVIKPAYQALIASHGRAESSKWKQEAQELVAEHKKLKSGFAKKVGLSPADIRSQLNSLKRRWTDDALSATWMNIHVAAFLVSGHPDLAASKHNAVICGSPAMKQWIKAWTGMSISGNKNLLPLAMLGLQENRLGKRKMTEEERSTWGWVREGKEEEDEDESPEPLVGGESPEPLVGGESLEDHQVSAPPEPLQSNMFAKFAPGTLFDPSLTKYNFDFDEQIHFDMNGLNPNEGTNLLDFVNLAGPPANTLNLDFSQFPDLDMSENQDLEPPRKADPGLVWRPKQKPEGPTLGSKRQTQQTTYMKPQRKIGSHTCCGGCGNISYECAKRAAVAALFCVQMSHPNVRSHPAVSSNPWTCQNRNETQHPITREHANKQRATHTCSHRVNEGATHLPQYKGQMKAHTPTAATQEPTQPQRHANTRTGGLHKGANEGLHTHCSNARTHAAMKACKRMNRACVKGQTKAHIPAAADYNNNKPIILMPNNPG